MEGSCLLPELPSVAPAHPPSPTPSPFLTWRDMQHLVVRASRPAQLQAEDWRTNGVGRQGAAERAGLGTPRPQGDDHAPPHSEPPLRLRAAGRRAAGGLGSLVAAHTAPEEMHHPHRAHPHVSALLCPLHARI